MRFEELFPEAISQRRILALIEARMNSGIRPLFGEIPEPYRLRFVSAKILSTVDFHHPFGNCNLTISQLHNRLELLIVTLTLPATTEPFRPKQTSRTPWAGFILDTQGQNTLYSVPGN